MNTDPGNGGPPSPHGTSPLFILPYMEGGNIYNNTVSYSWTGAAIVKSYVSPWRPDDAGQRHHQLAGRARAGRDELHGHDRDS